MTAAELILEPDKGKAVGPTVFLAYAMNQQGYLIDWPFDPPESEARYFKTLITNWDPDIAKELKEVIIRDAIQLFGPVIYALALMNCSGVSLVRDPIPSKRRIKLERETGREGPESGINDPHIITIGDVISAELERVRRERGGLPGLRGIVRGHFKTYSEEAPLFGMWSGQWRWSP